MMMSVTVVIGGSTGMLDGGPSRVSQSLERRPLHKAEPVRRIPEPQAVPEPEPRPPVSVAHQERSIPATQKPSKNKKPFALMIIILVIALAGVVGWYIWKQTGALNGAIDRDRYQAVLLSGGQSYFGKLDVLGGGYLRLSDVFYVQSGDSTDTADSTETTDDASMQLIKRGGEVHGPEDTMLISQDQVVFIENLKTDSKVSELIDNYTSGGK